MQFWGKILDMRGTSFQRKRLIILLMIINEIGTLKLIRINGLYNNHNNNFYRWCWKVRSSVSWCWKLASALTIRSDTIWQTDIYYLWCLKKTVVVSGCNCVIWEKERTRAIFRRRFVAMPGWQAICASRQLSVYSGFSSVARNRFKFTRRTRAYASNFLARISPDTRKFRGETKQELTRRVSGHRLEAISRSYADKRRL